MKREDFIFTIGYEGDTAIVDGQRKKKYGKLSTDDLAKEGFYKAAFCSALYSENEAEMNSFIDLFSEKLGGREYTKEGLKRLFGVFGVPEGIEKVQIL